jgi:hypothetical protein
LKRLACELVFGTAQKKRFCRATLPHRAPRDLGHGRDAVAQGPKTQSAELPVRFGNQSVVLSQPVGASLPKSPHITPFP